MYLLRLAMRPWRMAPWSQLFSALAVGLLLLLVGFLYWMQHGLKPVLARLHGEQVVTAYLDPAVDAKDEGHIVDSIRLAVGAHPEINLVEGPQFLTELKEQYPDLARELDDLGSEANTVIPRFVSVTGLLPDTALDKIKAVPGIESAESSKDRYRHIIGAFSALRWVARVLAGGLCVALLTGLIHLARMNSYLHKDAIGLLRLWGASQSMMLMPSILSGLAVGVIGGVIGSAGWISGGVWLASHVRALSPVLREMPVSHMSLAFALLLAGAAVGLLAGVCGGISFRAGAETRG